MKKLVNKIYKKVTSNSKLLVILSFIIMVLLVMYGFYEKQRKIELYKNFKNNKKLLCGDVVVQKSNGWVIRNNRFVTNGKIMKIMVFCKSAE